MADLTSAAARGRVLVVEEDEALRVVTTGVLAEAGFDAMGTGASEALDEAARTDPDVIVLDVRLPQSDDEAFLREYRKRPRSRARVIVVSGSPIDRAIELLGIDASLSKPYDIDELVSTVRSLMTTVQGA